MLRLLCIATFSYGILGIDILLHKSILKSGNEYLYTMLVPYTTHTQKLIG